MKRIYPLLYLVLILAGLQACRQDKPAESSQHTEAMPELPADVTFNEHIASVVYSNCTPCHRKGESGPFPLECYADVFKKKKTIVKVTTNGYMPPWPADRSYSSFAGEMFLSDYQKKLIEKWVEQGAPEGDSSKKTPLPVFPQGSQLGTPDMVVRMPKPFRLKGDNSDHYMFMKIPVELPAERYIRAIEFVPDNRRRVHHVNGYVLAYDEGKKKDLYTESYYTKNYEGARLDAYKQMNLMNDDGSFPPLIPAATNYLPGVIPPVYPDGIGGFTMKKKNYIFLNDIHYGPTPKDETDQSYFNIFFSDVPPSRRIKEFQLGNYGVSEIHPKLMIPPDSVKTFYTQYTIAEDMSLLTINPHMHLLGKSFLAYATSPDGQTIPLIRINRWDFRWQYFYTFKKMLKLLKGTTIYVEATYDNTRDNPNNPNDPPQWVGEREGSMSTKDEMLQFIITYLPYRQGDENIVLENTKIGK
jgi:hypothetical protein